MDTAQDSPDFNDYLIGRSRNSPGIDVPTGTDPASNQERGNRGQTLVGDYLNSIASRGIKVVGTQVSVTVTVIGMFGQRTFDTTADFVTRDGNGIFSIDEVKTSLNGIPDARVASQNQGQLIAALANPNSIVKITMGAINLGTPQYIFFGINFSATFPPKPQLHVAAKTSG